MTQTDHPRNGGLVLFLAFVGGALVGGAAAVLLAPRSGPEMRRRISGAVHDTKEAASRIPQAIREASSAAQAAFAAALKETGEDAAISSNPR
jgi:gas vesicle protein